MIRRPPSCALALAPSRAQTRAAFVGVLTFGACVASRSASAQSFTVDFRAPPECGNQVEFENGVARVLGRPFAELGAAWSRVEVTIESRAGGYFVGVLVESSSGARRARSLVAGSCREALDASELIVGTSLSGLELAEPEGADAPPQSPGEKAPVAKTKVPEPPRATPPRNVPPRIKEPARKPAALRVELGARIAVESALLPRPAELGIGTLALSAEAFTLEASAGLSTNATEGIAGGSARLSLFRAGLAGCYSLRWQSVRFGPCAGFELGELRAAGHGLPNSRGNGALWSAALLDARAMWALARHFALLGGLELVLPSRRMEVTLFDRVSGQNQPVFTTSAVDVRPFLGFVAVF